MSFYSSKSQVNIWQRNARLDLTILADFGNFLVLFHGVANEANNLREGHYYV